MRIRYLFLFILLTSTLPMSQASCVPYLEEWGIYEFDPSSGEIDLFFSASYKIENIRLSPSGDRFAFAAYFDGDDYEYAEICTVNLDGTGLTQLTDNSNMDVMPVWSPDGEEIAFLSWRDTTMDIWVMNQDGSDQRLLYDSGYHDGDVHWVDGRIVFTRNSQIWIMDSDGSNPMQLTDPPRAGEWGDAVLPFGDYDPRLSPDGSTVVFERLVDDSSQHGNYDLFTVKIDGTGEARLTETGWTQGIASWSSDGQRLAYLVSAKGTEGAYDLYMINSDGSEMTDLTSDIFPAGFLAHYVIFSPSDTIYFVGQWWGWEKLETTLTCEVNESTVYETTTVTVTGSVEPNVADGEIQLTVKNPDGSEETYEVPIAGGGYSQEIDIDTVGEWEIQAYFEGDAGHLEASSQSSVTRAEAPPEPDDKNGGIPGFPVLSLLIGASLLVSLNKRWIAPP